MKNAFISWSGGKDCCLTAYKAVGQGFNVSYLLNMVTADKSRSCSHGISAKWIALQAEVMGFSLLQYPTTGENYQSVFVESLKNLKSLGVTTGFFGDIDFEPHREWIEKICAPSCVKPVLPLWGRSQTEIVSEFIDAGFQAKIVATRADIMGEEWLGRDFDDAFVKDIAKNKEITPCGEAGEFHTLVVDGPLFKKRINIVSAINVQRGEHWFLDIEKAELVDKK